MRPPSPGIALLLTGLSTFAAALGPRSASACSLAGPRPVAGSLPADGDVDLPLDVRPVIVGNMASLAVRSSDGTSVAFGVDRRSQGMVVTFSEPLAADTEYTLEVEGSYAGTASVTFTTGSTTLGEAGVPAIDRLAVAGLVAERTSGWIYYCREPREYLCLGATVPEGHVLVIDAATAHDGVDSMLLTPGIDGSYVFAAGFYAHDSVSRDGMSSFTLTEWEPSTCVSAHLEDLAGNRGPAHQVCPGDFPVHRAQMLTRVACHAGVFDFEDDPGTDRPGPDAGEGPGEAESDLSLDGDGTAEGSAPGDPGVALQGSDEESSSGCSAAPPARRPPGSSWIVLAGLGVLGWRRAGVKRFCRGGG